MRAITNNYRDSHILNLGSGDERGPYLVTQTGVSPNDPLAKERMFVLRPDGRWVDFNAYACQDKPEAMDEIVFFTTTEVMEAFGKLMGRPQVLDLPVGTVMSRLHRGRAQLRAELATAQAVAARRVERSKDMDGHGESRRRHELS